MDSIGAEVGQKMRSAIKAKLTELECYVDDELPDYIMVMVANKRSKSQMNEDLQLFLTTKTAAFVDWLHIVLKKLKEVTVTNPEVYRKVSKRKLDEPTTTVNIKKEKKVKKEKKSKKSQAKLIVEQESQEKSLTDDLPMNVTKLSDQRRVMVMNENEQNVNLNEDNFDIPPLSEVDGSGNREMELEEIENKIKNVKSRLGLLVDSDSNDDDCINIKAEPDELFPEKKDANKKMQESEQNDSENLEKENSPEPKTPPRVSSPSLSDQKSDQSKKTIHERITFGNDREKTPPLPKRKSVMERLGKRKNSVEEETSFTPKKSRSGIRENKRDNKSKISLSEKRREEDSYAQASSSHRDRRSEASSQSEDKHRKNEKGSVFSRISDPDNHNRGKDKSVESILSRLGVQSKVSIPKKDEEEPFKMREVPSTIKIKPRVIPPDTPQANKNLLLKAVAEAQRSIALTPTVGNNIKPEALFTRKYKEQILEERSTGRKLSDKQKNKIKNIIVQISRADHYSSHSEEEDLKYIPKPLKSPPHNTNLNYTPSSKLNNSTGSNDERAPGKQHNFIVTLDGIERVKTKQQQNSVKSRLEGKKSPSPIVFDKINVKATGKVINVPDKLPVVHASPLLKNKERCKYWPACRQGDKCEFVHPTSNCEKFPNCKFGDKCLYTHPSCKFSSSCTRRDCPYSHVVAAKSPASRAAVTVLAPTKSALQTCKFFPNCTNISCPFYHPKPCKFGKFCKNQAECTFMHSFSRSKSNLTWRPK